MAGSCCDIRAKMEPLVSFCKEAGADLTRIAAANKVRTVFLASIVVLVAFVVPFFAAVTVASYTAGFLLTKLGWELRNVKILRSLCPQTPEAFDRFSKAVLITAVALTIVLQITTPNPLFIYSASVVFDFLLGSLHYNENKIADLLA